MPELIKKSSVVLSLELKNPQLLCNDQKVKDAKDGISTEIFEQ
jgi:hypothetical protein